MLARSDSPIKVVFENVPDAIKPLRRWVTWVWACRDGDRTKVPVIADEPDSCFGWQLAKSTAPITWRRYEAAAYIATHYDEIAGIGFVLGDGWSGVDLDKSRDPDSGQVNSFALDIVTELQSYTEISPSSTGLKTLIKGVKPEGRCKTAGVEIYSGGRFFTITGRHLPGTLKTIEDRQAELMALHAHLFPVSIVSKAAVQVADIDWDMPAVSLAALSHFENEKLKVLLARSAAASVGSRSDTDFAFCCEAARLRLDRDQVYALCRDVGKFAQAGRRYFDLTWNAALRNISTELAEIRYLKELYPGVYE